MTAQKKYQGTDADLPKVLRRSPIYAPRVRICVTAAAMVILITTAALDRFALKLRGLEDGQ